MSRLLQKLDDPRNSRASRTLNAAAQSATLTVGGTAVASQQGASTPAPVQWPGGGGGASITLTPDIPDQKSTLERTGPWGLFRLVDAGAASPHGNAVNVGFVEIACVEGDNSNEAVVPSVRVAVPVIGGVVVGFVGQPVGV